MISSTGTTTPESEPGPLPPFNQRQMLKLLVSEKRKKIAHREAIMQRKSERSS